MSFVHIKLTACGMSADVRAQRGAAAILLYEDETTVARDSVILAAGSAAAGIFVYLFFALATRSLGAEGAAPVAVLWTYWAIAAAVLTFAVQHWTIRTLTHDGHGGTIARSLPMLSMSTALLAVLTGGVAFVFRETLFGDDGLVFPALTAGITAGSFFVGLVRGALAGRRRYPATAVSLLGENAVRVVAATGVALAGGGPEAFGLALVVGPLICVVWLGSLRFDSGAAGSAVRNPLALVSDVAGGSLIAQVVLTGTPMVLAATGGSPAAVTSLFVALAVWRAPYVIALGITPQVTAAFTRLVADERFRRIARIRLFVGLGVLAGAGVAVLASFTVMPALLRLAFGPAVRLDEPVLATLGIGTVIALGNVVLLLLLLAYGRTRPATRAWAAALVVSAIWLLLSPMPPESRVVVAFLLAQFTAAVLLVLATADRRPPS